MNYEKLELNSSSEPSEKKIKNEKLISQYSIETSISIRSAFPIDEILINSISFFSANENTPVIPKGFSKIQRYSLYSPAISTKINEDKTIDILIEPAYPLPFSKVIIPNTEDSTIYQKGEIIGVCEAILGENKVFYQVKTTDSKYIKIPTNECVLDSDYKFLYFYEELKENNDMNIICAIRYKGELTDSFIKQAKEQFYESNSKYKNLEEQGTITVLVSETIQKKNNLLPLRTDSYVRTKKWTNFAEHVFNNNSIKKNKP